MWVWIETQFSKQCMFRSGFTKRSLFQWDKKPSTRFIPRIRGFNSSFNLIFVELWVSCNHCFISYCLSFNCWNIRTVCCLYVTKYQGMQISIMIELLKLRNEYILFPFVFRTIKEWHCIWKYCKFRGRRGSKNQTWNFSNCWIIDKNTGASHNRQRCSISDKLRKVVECLNQCFPTFSGLRHPTKEKHNLRHLVANPQKFGLRFSDILKIPFRWYTEKRISSRHPWVL